MPCDKIYSCSSLALNRCYDFHDTKSNTPRCLQCPVNITVNVSLNTVTDWEC